MDKELLHTRAVREILSMIASGEFTEGCRLPAERRLCEQFGISRGTLRKALADLEKIGAVAIRPQSGVYVQRFSQKKVPKKILPKNFKGVSLKDVILARKAIETSAIELACEQLDEDDTRFFDDLMDQMEQQVDDLPAYLCSDMAFHEGIVRASRNYVLMTAFEAISEYHKYSQVFSSTDDSCENDSLVFHKKIVKALKNRNGRQSVRCLSEHFDHMLATVS